MRAAITILCGFAAAWAIAGLHFLDMAQALYLVPVAISVGLLWWSRQRQMPERTAEQNVRIRRLVLIWTGIELVAILIAYGYLSKIGHAGIIAPVIAIIVGLHFFPLARGIPSPTYIATASAMIFAGGTGLAFPPAVTCFVAALVLWATSAVLLFKQPAAEATRP